METLGNATGGGHAPVRQHNAWGDRVAASPDAQLVHHVGRCTRCSGGSSSAITVGLERAGKSCSLTASSSMLPPITNPEAY